MSIVHFAEISVIAAAIELKADAIVIDERITRSLIESPKAVLNILKQTLHTSVSINESNLKEFGNTTNGLKVMRSVELVTMAYEFGMLDNYITKLPNARKNLLESILWGVKLNGCAVSRDEIEQIMKLEIK